MNEKAATELSIIERIEDAIVEAVMEQELFNATIAKQMGKLWISGEAGIDLSPIARAVLRAMRDPTKEMIYDGNTGIDDCIDFYNYDSGSGYTVEPHAAYHTWQKMIDAALSTEAVG